MKFKSKSKSKETKHHRSSKAVDHHLEEEIEVWANNSFGSVASSVTAPPSQTASFYKRVLAEDFEFSSSDGSDSLQDGCTNQSEDDNLSWADNRSRGSSDFGGDSEGAVKKPSKKDKMKKFRKGRRMLFGGAIQEDHDGENEDAPPPTRRGRRLSLFGNAGTGSHQSDQEISRSTDGEFSINRSDDGYNFSQDGSNEGHGCEDIAPIVNRVKAKRRGSLGGYFSKKENQSHQSEDVAQLSQDGSIDSLGYGYEETAPSVTPSVTREKPKRRGSLGGLFTKKDNTPEEAGHLSQENSNDTGDYGYEEAEPTITREKPKRRGSLGGYFSKKDNTGHQSDDGGQLSQDGNDEGLGYGYEDAAPSITREKPKRRGSLGGMFTKKDGRRGSITGTSEAVPPPESNEDHANGHHSNPNRARRNSLFGGNSASEHIPTGHKKDQASVNDQSLAAASAHTTKTSKSHRRRNSLTSSNYKTGSVKAVSIPQDPHWIINQERKARGMPIYDRNLLLDTLAKSLCNELASGLPPTPTEFYGNVGRGNSLQMIHTTIMDDRGGISRKNILSEKFTEFGAALTQGNDGQLYMVALFKE